MHNQQTQYCSQEVEFARRKIIRTLSNVHNYIRERSEQQGNRAYGCGSKLESLLRRTRRHIRTVYYRNREKPMQLAVCKKAQYTVRI